MFISLRGGMRKLGDGETLERVCADDKIRRGKSGGQVRDEYRDEYDPGRGGFGRAVDAERLKEEEEYGKGR